MNLTGFKIVPRRIPVVHLRNKRGDSITDQSLKKTNNSSRILSTDYLTCEYVSDGSTVIKLSELVKRLKEHKEIKLTPLSLTFNENVTEHVAAKDNEGFSSVTIHVDVEDSKEGLTPTKIVTFTQYSRRSYDFIESKNIKDSINEDDVLIQIFPVGKNKNCIEIKTSEVSQYDINDEGWYIIIPKREYGKVIKMTVFGSCRNNEYQVYELESSGLQQNQKLTVLNYLK